MDYSQPFGGLVPGPTGAVLSVLLRTSAPLTGRQVHRLAVGDFALSSIQHALNTLIRLGLVKVTAAGRANLHTINPDHQGVEPLRALLDPLSALETVIEEAVDCDVHSVILFGSIARGEATQDSDVDLAVIAAPDWKGRVDLQEAVKRRLGNDCDVLVFTETDYANSSEPVVSEIARDGVALFGMKPSMAWAVAS